MALPNELDIGPAHAVRPTILIIEDDLDDCQQYGRVLKAALPNAHCLWAHTAAEGLALLRAFHPHCIMLDLRLPDLNGLQFLETLRGNPPLRACTVLVITAHGDESMASAATRLGAFEYLVKDVEGRFLQRLPQQLERALAATDEQRRRDLDQDKFAQLARRHETILNSLSEGILITRPDFTIISTNPAIGRMFGYEAHELLGKSVEVLVPADRRDSYGQVFAEYWATGKSPLVGGAATATRGVHKDGRLLHVEWSVVEVQFDDRQALAIVLRDVSERYEALHALQESDARFRGAFENAPIGMALGSVDGAFLRVNRALSTILGYSEEELLNRDLRSLAHPDDESVRDRVLRNLFERGQDREELELRLIHKDGRTVWVLNDVSLVRDDAGAPMYLIGQFQDITERKNIERRKGEFLAMVSHELRTPLTAIRGSLSLIANDAAGVLPPKAKSLIRMAHRNSERLSRLIGDILDMERIEAGGLEYHMEPVELCGLLQESVDELHAYAEQLQVQFDLRRDGGQIWVHGDHDRIIQVMANLLSNAAKFSPRGGVVTVTAARIDSHVRIAVADRGKGIPGPFQKMVFQRFAQADALGSGRKGGTGLGLSISKAIVERHGGSIWFVTQAEVGTTFYVELPLSTAASVDTLSEREVDPHSSG